MNREELLRFTRVLMTDNAKLSRLVQHQQLQARRSETVSVAANIAESVRSAEHFKMEKYMRLLLVNSRNIVLFFDREGRLVYCTSIFLRLAGAARMDELSGRTVREVFGSFADEALLSDAVRMFENARDCLEAGTMDARVEVGDGKPAHRFYSVMTSPLLEADGRFDGIIMVFHDITDMKARILAEDANAAKDRFIANVSHEIRTPLNVLLGLAELELQNDLPEETSVNLEKIYAAGLTLLGLINDILDISKMEAGKFELFPEEYDFPDMLSEVVSINVVRIASKPVCFNVDVDENLPVRLYGDMTRVKQILTNLLSNAFKFTDKGSVTLRVFGERDGDEICLAFVISDTGKGIRQEDMGKLFRSYSQIGSGKIEGTGLGLVISKNLVEMMGGTINAESSFGRGSSFTAALCQRVVSDKPIGAQVVQKLRDFRLIKSYRQKANPKPIQMPEGRVLVIDDVSTNLDVAKGLMAKYGLTVHCVSSGREALEMICSEPPYDLIFMDHMMPDMDGLEAARLIRTDAKIPAGAGAAPIIMLTANALTGSKEMFLQHGIDDFLAKPIDIARLDAVLRAWMPKEKQFEPDADGGKAKNAAPPVIAGLDSAAALKCIGGSARKYQDLLLSFCRDADDKNAQITRCAQNGDFSLYTTLVHGLKGAASYIGATELAQCAARLEHAGRNGDAAAIGEQTPEFLAAMRELVARIRAGLAPAPAGNAFAPQADLRLDELKAALQKMDIEVANRLLAGYAEMSLDAKSREAVARIEDQVLLFEYEKAIAVIDSWTKVH
jgi:PAS domain S-box-containing protein